MAQPSSLLWSLPSVELQADPAADLHVALDSTAETADLAAPGNAALAGAPAVAAAHHLYSRGPAALQSPMSRAGLTPAQVNCHRH